MKSFLSQMIAGQRLDYDQTVSAFEKIMTGQASPEQIAALLVLIEQLGPDVQQISGAAYVMRQKAEHVPVPVGLTAIDTCGTGGDHAGTFNISTAAGIVAAAAGRPHDIVVAKHGNRSVTSNSGSSQVLQVLGVNLHVTVQTQQRCLSEAGICFCFAQAHHPAMKHVVPIRQALGIRTIFNLLGPLTNPAGATRQVIGVFDAKLTEPIAKVLASLGSCHAMVVHGQMGEAGTEDASGDTSGDASGVGGLDEISTDGPTQITLLKQGQVTTTLFDSQSLGIPKPDLNQLKAKDAAQSAGIITGILAGDPGPARDIVCLNAAAALVVAGLAQDLAAGYPMACQAIDDGSGRATLAKWVQLTEHG